MTTFWTSTAGLFKTVEILRVLVYVSTGVFLVETIHAARFDWSLLSGNRQFRSTHFLYFGTKLSYLAFLIQIIVAFWLQEEVDCQAYLYAWEFLMGLTVITSSTLLACRTIAVNNQHAARGLVKVIVVIAVLGLTAAWMQGVTDVTAVWATAAASPWNSGACLWTAVKDTYFVKYVVTIVFDLIILVLTVTGIARMKFNSRFGTVLIQQGFLYVLFTIASNLVVTVLTILQLSPTMSLIAAIPQSTICVIASTRLYAQLAQEAAKTVTTSHGQITTNTLVESSSSNSKSTGSLLLHKTTLDYGGDLEKGIPDAPIEAYSGLDIIMEHESSSRSFSQPCITPVVPFLQHHPFSDLVPLEFPSRRNSETRQSMIVPTRKGSRTRR